MLNTVWSSHDDISIKEELKEDVISNPASPYHSSSLGNPHSSPYRSISVTDYHRLSPNDAAHQYFYAGDSENSTLQTLLPLPLPPFPNLQPESPTTTSNTKLNLSEVPTISISEISSSCSGSESAWLLTSHDVDSTQNPVSKSRKRTNSGSSGSSANSGSCGTGNGQSRAKTRRRQHISQEELHNQRNQGEKASKIKLKLFL